MGMMTLRVARSHLQRCLARGVCPACGSGKVSYGKVEVNREETTQGATCQCGATWNEHYRISHIGEFEMPGRVISIDEKT